MARMHNHNADFFFFLIFDKSWKFKKVAPVKPVADRNERRLRTIRVSCKRSLFVNFFKILRLVLIKVENKTKKRQLLKFQKIKSSNFPINHYFEFLAHQIL